MKITTSNKDYYDFHARSMLYSDKTYSWNRTPKHVRTPFSVPMHFSDSNFSFIYDHTLCGFMIHFCGQMIPCVYFARDGKNDNNSGYYYRLEDLPKEVLELRKRTSIVWKKIVDLFEVVNHPWCHKLMSGQSLSKISLIEMHRRLHTPIFINGSLLNDSTYIRLNDPLTKHAVVNPYYTDDYEQILINPQLHAFQFIRYMDSFSVFNELERFISNELAPNSDDKMNVKIPDSIKVESKGFDKWSFRKMKA